LRLSLLHGCSPEGVAQLRADLDAAECDYELDSTGLVGAVIGTYSGPDAIGCAYYPKQ
jgi:fatty acid-binding protein DegV